MKLDNVLSSQVWFVVLIVGGIIWLGWFLSSDIDQSAIDSTDIDDSALISDSVDDNPPPEFGVVSDIIDSLTIVLDDKFIVRYLGVMTPTTLDKVGCFGKEALQANESLIGKTVRLEEDPVLSRALDTAWVRYVWVAEDGESQEAYTKALSGASVAGLNNMPPIEAEGAEEQVEAISGVDDVVLEESEELGDNNDELDKESLRDEEQAENKIKEYLVSERIVEMGLGFPLLSKDMIYHEKISAAARFSSATKRGLWGACEILEGENGLLETQKIEECVIKGVKLLNGQQVFRTSQCRSYKDTVVLKYKGDEWLCSEEEAVEKGFVKAIDC